MKENFHQKNIIDDLLATLQALVENDKIKLDFVDVQNDFLTLDQTSVSEEKIMIPKVSNITQGRAAVDLAACYLLFHDNKIHDEFEFFGEEKTLFDQLEKARVVAQVKDLYPGMVNNIVQKIEKDLQGREGLEVYMLPLMLMEMTLGVQNFLTIPKPDDKIIQHLKKLTKLIQNQQAFARTAQDFIEFLRDQKNSQEAKNQTQDKPLESNPKKDDPNINEETPQTQAQQEFGEEEKPAQENLPEEKQTPKLEESGFETMQLKGQATNILQDKIEFKKSYHVFTNRFDEIILPQKLVDKNELEILRYSLELRLAKLAGISKKLTLKLKKKLLAKRNHYIEHNDSAGIIDRRRFAQMIADPSYSNFYVEQKQREYQDTIVSIILDNSGSMRGQPIVMAALACEIIASILEKFSIKTEILGFTTSDWKGGKSRKLWEAQGKPRNPGRLSDLRHIIYKSANQNFKKAKMNLGLMLKEGMLKENIDGEALLWARSRLMQRDEKRKILMVISDGTPVDDSTNSCNEFEILVDHLHHVIHLIEKHSKIEIVGIGIGHHVDNFYRNSISIKSAEDLGNVMIEKIADLV